MKDLNTKEGGEGNEDRPGNEPSHRSSSHFRGTCLLSVVVCWVGHSAGKVAVMGQLERETRTEMDARYTHAH